MTRTVRPFGRRRTPRPPLRPRPAAALSTLVMVALLLTATGCGDAGPDGNSPSDQRSSATGRPSSEPTPTWDASPASIAALGDSITVGFDACDALSDCPEVSWATGTDPSVDSLARRLVKNPAAHSWNHARTGALMSDLPEQVDAAVGDRPALVTVLIGANDACRPTVAAMTSADAFRADFETSVRKLRRALPRTQLYVAAVPDLMRLWSQGRGNPTAKRVWQLGICGSMLRAPDDLSKAATDRRQEVRERVVAYNAALKEVCDKDTLCRFDPAVFDYRFTGEQLSAWDWFHPSRRGQHELAELAHRVVTRENPRL